MSSTIESSDGKNQRTARAVFGWLGTLSLGRQFLVLSSILVLVSFGILGFWVANKIEESVKIDIGLRAALYMDSVLSPLIQELDEADALSEGSIAQLHEVLEKDVRRLDVQETRVWNLDGKVLFSTAPGSAGQTYEITADIASAIAGNVSIDFDMHPHDGELATADADTKFEIYVPIRSDDTGRVIAVAEFYQNGSEVIAAIAEARQSTLIVTSLVCLGLIAGLYLVVDRGSRLIDAQRTSLDLRVLQLTALLDQNEALRHRIDEATQRSTEDYESLLRRIGSDLHDGIGQLLTIVSLRLDSIFPKPATQSADYRNIKTMIDDAMTEVRHMAAGLALPQIKSLLLVDAVRSVVARHEYQTSTKVDVHLGPVPVEPRHPVKLGICRMVQEGLANAFKHANGAGQSVTLDCSRDRIVVEVADKGPGIVAKTGTAKRESLGLIGLRNRLESMGGVLTVQTGPVSGTILRVEFSLPVEPTSVDPLSF